MAINLLIKNNFFYWILLFIIVIASILLCFVLSNLFRDNQFILIDKKQMSNKETNKPVLYSLTDHKKQHFFTADKLLPNKYFQGLPKGVKLEKISTDIFWEPRTCASMKNFVVGKELFFLNTVFNNSNNDENIFSDFLYIYNIEENSLTTYKLKKHVNILDITKTKNGEVNFLIKLKDKNKLVKLNLEKLTVQNENLFRFSENQDYDYFEKSKDESVYEDKPYVLKFFDEKTPFFQLFKQDQIYYFLIE